jgi:hypothetical protein
MAPARQHNSNRDKQGEWGQGLIHSPDVEYCGYSAPHPSEDKIHLRIQMYDGLSAVDCLRKALGNLRDLFKAVGAKYSASLECVFLFPSLRLFIRGAPSELVGE